jgi:predicted nucleic acid-binding protein
VSRPVFVDTSYLFAGIQPTDAHHEVATRLGEAINGRHLVTTNHVRGETWTLLRRRDGHRMAWSFIEEFARTATSVEHLSAQLETEALGWLLRHDEREYSFVDATSFAFMRSRGITEALAFDGDFAAAGFTELRP